MNNSAAVIKRVHFAPAPSPFVIFWVDQPVNELMNGDVEDDDDSDFEEQINYTFVVDEFSIAPLPILNSDDENNTVPSPPSSPSPPPSPQPPSSTLPPSSPPPSSTPINRAPKRPRDDADADEASPEPEAKRVHLTQDGPSPSIPLSPVLAQPSVPLSPILLPSVPLLPPSLSRSTSRLFEDDDDNDFFSSPSSSPPSSPTDLGEWPFDGPISSTE